MVANASILMNIIGSHEISMLTFFFLRILTTHLELPMKVAVIGAGVSGLGATWVRLILNLPPLPLRL